MGAQLAEEHPVKADLVLGDRTQLLSLASDTHQRSGIPTLRDL
jgi:glutamine phosphoribosylpyrophosphate amidotransferase